MLTVLADATRAFRTVQVVTLRVHPTESQLWFTHNSVNSQFSHGDHQGRSLLDLVDAIVEAHRDERHADPLQHDKLVFDGVLHHGCNKAFQNRRLWSVWEAARRLCKPLTVRVRLHPLLPKVYYNNSGHRTQVLEKFSSSHTTSTNGGEPDFREPLWLRRYRGATRNDGQQLSTSKLKVLDRLLDVARRIVDGPEGVFVLSGSTGCGKSTQVPQAVYDYVRDRHGEGQGPAVVCTQPRRVAACSLDAQVHIDRTRRSVWNEERSVRITAHQIKGSTNKGPHTRILYCTAGVLVQMLRGDAVREFNYIFLDEIHERTIEDDLLLAFLCRGGFLRTGAKIVIMSATLAVDEIVRYVAERLESSNRVATIDLDGTPEMGHRSLADLRNLAEASGVFVDGNEATSELLAKLLAAQVLRSHPLRLVYLDELISAIATREGLPVELSPVGRLSSELSEAAIAAWRSLKLNYEGKSPQLLLAELLHLTEPPMVISGVRECFAQFLCCELMRRRVCHETASGSAGEEREYVTLTFLPGVSFISDFQYSLQESGQLAPSEIRLLHGRVRQDEQNEAVQGILSGERRAILATNVAESSVTVPNADVVLDLCLAREMRWNDDRGTQLLDLARAAKDSLAQRAGRVGRTKPGLVLRMLTRAEYDMLRPSRTPEMLRQPVESVMLKVICIGGAARGGGIDAEGDVRSCLSPPEPDKVAEALESLESMSAIQEVSRADGRILWRPMRLGVVLDDLPVSVDLGVIAVRGFMIGAEACTADAAAMLHAHNVVAEPRNTLRDGGRAFVAHCKRLRSFARGFPSDVVMLVNLLRAFRREAKRVNWLLNSCDPHGEQLLRSWCACNGANFKSLCGVDVVAEQIREKLRAASPSGEEAGLAQGALPDEDLSSEESALLMLLLAGAFRRNMLQVFSKPPSQASQMSESEVQISWKRSQNSTLTLQRIVDFFALGRGGARGEILDHSLTGARDGWARVQLAQPTASGTAFGFPSEVVDVLKLERDLCKLVGDSSGQPPPMMHVQHVGSTCCVPLFHRWEALTRKLENVALDLSSVAVPYLELTPLPRDSVVAVLVPRRFESFHTKSQNKWQKGECLTLLPAGPNSLAALILAIFGAPPQRGDMAQALACEGLMASVEGLASAGDSAEDCRIVQQGLTGAQCLLQEFHGPLAAGAFVPVACDVERASTAWEVRTIEVREALLRLLDSCGGVAALQALSRSPCMVTPQSVGVQGLSVHDRRTLDATGLDRGLGVLSAFDNLSGSRSRTYFNTLGVDAAFCAAERSRDNHLEFAAYPFDIATPTKRSCPVTASFNLTSIPASSCALGSGDDPELLAAIQLSLEGTQIGSHQRPTQPSAAQPSDAQHLRQLRLRHFGGLLAEPQAAAGPALQLGNNEDSVGRSCVALSPPMDEPRLMPQGSQASQVPEVMHASQAALPAVCPDCGQSRRLMPYCGMTGRSHNCESAHADAPRLDSSHSCAATGHLPVVSGSPSAARSEEEKGVEQILSLGLGRTREQVLIALDQAGGSLDGAVALLL
eukprot:TRINITY_DN3887_c0_g1_i1.p1 TRINITY_DN3887_c0_g1~~TRINITY_DN3887_c0_g1_i1.p1  ORF type:complete len:1583 (-),score=218.56 TRINITY_DN3887_c0_g1_i1:350-4942(-)